MTACIRTYEVKLIIYLGTDPPLLSANYIKLNTLKLNISEKKYHTTRPTLY